MGMYDTINGEQVKCFYWTHYYNPQKKTDGCHLCSSGGNLQYFDTGNKVPFKTNAYNYTENFIVLDAHFRTNTKRCSSCNIDYFDDEKTCPECGKELEKCPAVIHIIRDGLVNNTFCLYEKDRKNSVYVEELNKKLFQNNNKIITYYGDELNIHSVEEIFNYIDNLKICTDYIVNSYNETNLYRDAIHEERAKRGTDAFSQERYDKLVDEYGKKVDAKNEKIQNMKNKYLSQFCMPSKIEEIFGQYLEVLYEYAGDQDRLEDYQMARTEFLAMYNEKLLEKYFSYIEANKQEQEDIKILIEQYQKEEANK